MRQPLCLVLILILILILSSTFTYGAEQQTIRPGELFPELSLPAPHNTADRNYLQLGDSPFRPSQIEAELLLVELLNVHCPHCQMQTPAYNELFKLIEGNPQTRGKIKMLAFAIGNLETEVEQFRRGYQVPFPILADPSFRVWRAVGGTATPFSIYVRQDRSGQAGIVTATHLGLNTNYQQIYQHLQQLAATDPAKLRQQAAAVENNPSQVEPILAPDRMEYRVRTAFTRFGGILDFSKLALLSGRQVYVALLRRPDGSRERIFAEVTSRASVCDICHDVHFIYLFDRSARVIAFEPLQLTKYGNVNWNQQEIEQMRRRVVGNYLTAPQPFNPAVDAVSSATMTSAIIFDSLAQGQELLQELRQRGLL